MLSDIPTLDLQNFRVLLVRKGRSPCRINNYLSAIKAMYHWAQENELVATIPNLKAIKKIPQPKRERPVFSPAQIRSLLDHASIQMKAMIWLALNCGFGCTDCSELLWEHLDLAKGRVSFPRTKTGIARNLPLWKETIAALIALPRLNARVFSTGHGNKYVRVVRKDHADGTTKLISYDAIGKGFARLMVKAGIKTEKGVGFYTLRRTAATLAARSRDAFAVQRLLGHADLKMASTYVQDISEQTDRVVNNMRGLLVQDGN
jgi:integrase